MKNEGSKKRLILPLVLSIVALLYTIAIDYFILKFRNYPIELEDNYVYLFKIAPLSFYLAIAYMLVNAKKEQFQKNTYVFSITLLLSLFFISVFNLLKYYQTNLNIGEKGILAHYVIFEYISLKSFIGKIKIETCMHIGLLLSLLWILISITNLFSYIFDKVEIENSIKKYQNGFKDILFKKVCLSLGFEYNTVP